MNIIKTGAKIVLGVEEHYLPELTEFRLSVCRACENFQPETEQCGVCTCFMDIKATLFTNRNPNPKTGGRIEITHCPLGRWHDKHIANAYRKLDKKELLQ